MANLLLNEKYGVSRRNVVDGYRIILGREPESEQVIHGYRERCKSLLQLQSSLYASQEYQNKHPDGKVVCFLSDTGGVISLFVSDRAVSIKRGEEDRLFEFFYQQVLQGREYVYLTDVEGNFLGEAAFRQSLREGRQGGHLFVGWPSLNVNEDEKWREDLPRIWQAWQNACPGRNGIPVVKHGKLIADISLLPSIQEEPEHLPYDIDVELFRLIQKYDIYRESPELQEIYQERYAFCLLNELMESLPTDGIIALAGADEDTQFILDRLLPHNRKKVSYVLDNTSTEITGGQAVPFADVEKVGISVAVISSWAQKELIKCKLIPYMGNVRIIDVYDYLEQHGVRLSGSLMEVAAKSFRHITYIDTNNALAGYNHASVGEKAFYLRRLIAYCIEIKSFVSAEKYMHMYIESGYAGFERYKGFLKSWQILVGKLRDMMSRREHEDIVVNWVDNISPKEFYDTDFAMKLRGQACIFYEAYSMTPQTHFTTSNILTGKRTIENHNWKIANYDLSNSPVLDALYDFGYRFIYIANPCVYQAFFAPGQVVKKPHGFEQVVVNRDQSECSSRLQWLALRERLMAEEPLCLWIHDLTETHNYGFLGECDISRLRIESRQPALDFLFEELEYYSQFRSEHQHEIYLSDHGNQNTFAKPYSRDLSNVSLIIRSPKIKPQEVHEMYSHVDFHKIIEQLLFKEKMDVKAVCSSYVIGENLDMMSSVLINGYINRWRHGAQMLMRLFQVLSVRTREDIYVRYFAGKELYFRGDDEKTNLIDEKQWQERIDYLRSLLPEFVDIYADDAFKDSRKLYAYVDELGMNKVPW